MPRFLAFLCLATIHATSASLFGQALPPRLRQTLATQLKASERQLNTVERGGIVSYSVDTATPGEIMLVGMARIWATPEAFVRAYRDITTFESAPRITAGGKFGAPPKDSDMTGLKLSRAEADELKACKPGNCAFKIDDPGLEFLRKEVNWDSPNYPDEAAKALRTLWLRYLLRYQSRGNKGLATYHDTPEYFSVAQGFSQLLAKAAALQEYAPELKEFLRNYPESKIPSIEEFFYWQVGDFGLKPVCRITHVAIQRIPAPPGDAYVIASKMLFASHYFRSALELRYLIPGQDQRTGGMHYMVTVQRAYVDGMTGFRGRLLRSIVIRRSRHAMEQYIVNAKAKVERDFNRK